MPDPNWTLEGLKIAQGLFGTLVGGGLVLFGGWLADKRRNKTDELLRQRRERALLTGMFAIRNYIAEQLNEWEADGLLSQLQPLRTAQSYVHRLIEKAPGESESLMIAVVDVGLRLDEVLALLDRRGSDPALSDTIAFAKLLSRQVVGLSESLEQLDLITAAELTFLSDSDLAEFDGVAADQDCNELRSA